MKIILTITPTGLVSESRIRFSPSWWSGNKKYFWFLFIASRPLLQSHAEFSRLLWKYFRTCYSCLCYSSMSLSSVIFFVSSFESNFQLNLLQWSYQHIVCQMRFITSLFCVIWLNEVKNLLFFKIFPIFSKIFTGC